MCCFKFQVFVACASSSRLRGKVALGKREGGTPSCSCRADDYRMESSGPR